ncbi:MAG: O-antigen ligase family protein [candidate division Zixibacteria bacterium]|nr:O-antigen ligase family protein [candidate division Zixibacteria bacterium]MBU1470280.1 O-antigen ligase family protein [candidate division Zixibacteria bacterium]MBU2626834.1 O-antigen ligase family protein [candidate division Zixibacteria bacterium]
MIPAMLVALLPLGLVLTIVVATRTTFDNLKIFAVLMPLQAFATLEAGFSIPPIYVFLVLILIGVAMKGEPILTDSPGSKPLMWFLAIAVLSTIAAAIWIKLPAVQFDNWMRFRASSARSPLQLALTLFHFLPFFLIVASAKTEDSANSLLKIHLGVGAVMICLGLYQIAAFALDLPFKDYTWSINAVTQSSIIDYGKVHAYGAGVTDFAARTTFVETRDFADYLLSVVPLAAALWISGSKQIKERFGFLASPLVAALGAITIFLTMSRSAWVILVISLLVLAFWLAPRSLLKQIPITFVLIAVAVVLLVKAGFFNESGISFFSIIAERLSIEGIITDPRVLYLVVAWDVFLTSPVLGVGAGNFSIIGADMLGFDVLASAHGIPWQALCEFGFLGFCALMVVFFSIMRSLSRSIKRSKIPNQRAILVGLFASLLALFLNSFTGHDRPPFYLIFIMGLSATYASLARKSASAVEAES